MMDVLHGIACSRTHGFSLFTPQLATKQAAVQEAKLALTAGIIKEDEGARQAEEKERGHVEALKAYKVKPLLRSDLRFCFY